MTLETPRDPQTWATVTALPVPDWHMDEVVVGKALSTLGRAAGGALFEHAQEAGMSLPPELTDPTKEPEPQVIIQALRDIAAQIFPRLAMNTPGEGT